MLEDVPKNRELIFYKEKLIDGYDEERDIAFNQTLFVTYSLKYKDYTKRKREAQIDRAKAALKQEPSRIDKNSQHDYKRFIKKEATVVPSEKRRK